MLSLLDQYLSLLSLKTNKSEIVKSDMANLSDTFSPPKMTAEDNTTTFPQLQTDPDIIFAQMYLKSRLHAPSKRSTPSEEDLTDKAKSVSKTDKLVLDLLSSGHSGGKVERSRHVLQKIDQSNDVSIDSISGRLLLHD